MLGAHVFVSRWKAVTGVPGAPGKPEMVPMASPVLVTVTVIGALIEPAAVEGNTIGLGLKISTGPLPPVPTKGNEKTRSAHVDSQFRWIPKLSVTTPAAVGLKVTPTTHEAPAASTWLGSSVIWLQKGTPLGGRMAVDGVQSIVKCVGSNRSENIAGSQPVQLLIFTSISALVVVVTGVRGNTSEVGE